MILYSGLVGNVGSPSCNIFNLFCCLSTLGYLHWCFLLRSEGPVTSRETVSLAYKPTELTPVSTLWRLAVKKKGTNGEGLECNFALYEMWKDAFRKSRCVSPISPEDGNKDCKCKDGRFFFLFFSKFPLSQKKYKP